MKKRYYYNKLCRVYKALETGIQLGGWDEQKNIGFDFRIQHKGDHRGVFFSMDLLFLFFEFNVYDTRHEDEDEKG